MNWKLTMTIFIIGLIFISGCTNQENQELTSSVTETNQEDPVEGIKSIVYNAILDYFPEASDTFSVSNYIHETTSERCGDQWFYQLGTEPIPYPRIQVCSQGKAYTLDELYTAYEEAADSYKNEDPFKDALFEVNREEFSNGKAISFKIKNDVSCENGITVRFPCKDKYVIELSIVYDCSNDHVENKINKVVDEILRSC